MDTSSASLPSRESLSHSSRSGHLPGTPKPPIDPPCRRSSLGFSENLKQSSPQPPHNSDDDELRQETLETPRRIRSNVGRKRTYMSPYTRSVATPGHVAQMQRIFSEAKASLQLDMHYASSPKGSIASRLPIRAEEGNLSSLSMCDSTNKSLLEARPKDWRYSTIPFSIKNKSSDVREPMPEQSPLLPAQVIGDAGQVQHITAEPVSSGFTSPADQRAQPDQRNREESSPLLSTFPASSPLDELSEISKNTPSLIENVKASSELPLSTDLEQPLTDLHFSLDDVVRDDEDDMNESPIVSHLKRMSGGSINARKIRLAKDPNIFLSAPSKAAAESAKAKRGILNDDLRSVSNKGNIQPGTDRTESAACANTIGYSCPNPSIHIGTSVPLCPDPSVHYRSHSPILLRPRNAHLTPSPNAWSYSSNPSPSPLRVSLPSGVPTHNRTDQKGSPLPISKNKSPIGGQSRRPFHPPTGYRTNPRQHDWPPSQNNRVSYGSCRTSAPDDHFQPGWYYSAAPPPPPDKAPSLAYAFSTAAAKVFGSSPAPESRIRDSYRTDTLTPLARPASRFRKNGIAAITRSAVINEYHSHAGDGYGYRPGLSNSGPHFHVRRHQRPPLSTGSPTRAVAAYNGDGLSARNRSMPGKRGHFEIVEDDTAHSQVAILEEGEEPMEIDDEIRAAVRMSVCGPEQRKLQDKSELSEQSNGNEEKSLKSSHSREPSVEGLSPNVNPYRKGLGPLRQRRPSYCDGDLPEITSGVGARNKKKSRGSPIKIAEQDATHPHGSREQGVVREEISFNANDLLGEVERAGGVLQRRLSGYVEAEDDCSEAGGHD